MYEAFYGLKEKPFSMLPDPGFLFLSKKHQTALTLLEYGLLNHVGFCVITGEPGAGKTTIVRALLGRIDERITVGLITNTHQSFGGLLDWVLSAFDLHRPNLTSVEMHQIFMEYLIEEYANKRTVLLIVDEAQNMKPDTLEELRMLSNVNSDKDQLLQVVLSGQPALKEMLSRPELMQFAQRIAVDYHLEALSVEETCGYIQHRLVTAGAEKDVFTPAACERIYNYSGGTPRLINLLCETVLVYGFADQKEMIDVELVDEMVQERMKNSVVPIVNRDIANQDNRVASEKLEKDFPWIRPKGETIVPDLKSEVLDEQPLTEQDEFTETISVSTEDSPSNDVSETIEAELSQEDKGESTKEVLGERPQQSISEQASNITGEVISSAEPESGNEAKAPIIKYGVMSVVFSLLLIVVVVMFSMDENATTEVMDDRFIELQVQQELEREQLKRLQMEAEALKQERDDALAHVEEEKRIREEAEKLAAEQAVIEQAAIESEKREAEEAAAAEIEEKKRVREEKKRKAVAREKAREEEYAIEREKRKAAKIEEEKRIKEQEDLRRLELEWLEKERKALEGQVIKTDANPVAVKETLVSEEVAVSSGDETSVVSEEIATSKGIKESAAVEAEIVGNVDIEPIAEETAVVQKRNNAECSGPTARFKANCR